MDPATFDAGNRCPAKNGPGLHSRWFQAHLKFPPRFRPAVAIDHTFRTSVMRTKSVVPRLRAKKRLFKRAKGSVGGRRRLLRTAKESLVRAGVFAFRDRRRKKRDFRRLWIVRINAAARTEGISYSQFIAGLSRAGITVDRKMLASLAVSEPAAFAVLASRAKDANKAVATA